MIKTGKPLLSVFLFVLFLGSATALKSQDISVETSLSETNIFTGEAVSLQIIISGTSISSLDLPVPPSIEGLRWLPNSTSKGTSYGLANGVTSIRQTYGYQFIAEAVGSHQVPSMDITVNGQIYRTKPIPFKVLDANAIDPGNADRSPDIYVRLEPSVENPVVGQQIIADVVLYFKSGIEVSSYQATPGWKAEGFWKEELDSQQRARATSSIVNGIRYQRARLLQYAIFPTKSGDLTLSPFEITVRLRQTRGNTRSIFGFGANQESREIETLPVTIKVGRIPEPDNGTYIGAVGDFQIRRTIKPSKAFIGESIEIITEITGSGNVPLLNKPEFAFPETLELYNPQENTTISRSNRVIAGTKVFTDIIIARNEGTYVIPEDRIAMYNPSKKGFEYTTLPALKLTVERDPRAIATASSDLRFDVLPSTGLANWTATGYIPLRDRTLVWALIFVPFLILIGAFGYKSYFDKLSTDQGFARSQRARATSLKTLEEASEQDHIKEAYHLIERALIQFITDKLNLPEAGLSTDQLIDAILKKSASIPTQELKLLFNKCETIAYAPNVTQQSLNDDIESARLLIKELSKSL